ncbi:hypothetical protein [Deinococcus sp. LM3]|uniref:hypothetical protein n=1 Tax=Deinococcus sp. LM3 TaxID=1938608 RepID=UPI001F0A67A6|nr:hypothetical protein [Deinococcus sp. LM3]
MRQRLPRRRLHHHGYRPSGRESITWDELTAQRPEIAQSWAAMQPYREEVGIEIH